MFTSSLFRAPDRAPERVLPCLLLGAAAALISLAPPAARGEPIGLYCSEDRAQIFAARDAGNGWIEFALSHWQGNHFCGIGGLAEPRGSGWEYAEDGCTLTIREEPGGGLGFAATPPDACAAFCGAGADLNAAWLPPGSKRRDEAPDIYFGMATGTWPSEC